MKASRQPHLQPKTVPILESLALLKDLEDEKGQSTTTLGQKPSVFYYFISKVCRFITSITLYTDLFKLSASKFPIFVQEGSGLKTIVIKESLDFLVHATWLE